MKGEYSEILGRVTQGEIGIDQDEADDTANQTGRDQRFTQGLKSGANDRASKNESDQQGEYQYTREGVSHKFSRFVNRMRI